MHGGLDGPSLVRQWGERWNAYPIYFANFLARFSPKPSCFNSQNPVNYSAEIFRSYCSLRAWLILCNPLQSLRILDQRTPWYSRQYRTLTQQAAVMDANKAPAVEACVGRRLLVSSRLGTVLLNLSCQQSTAGTRNSSEQAVTATANSVSSLTRSKEEAKNQIGRPRSLTPKIFRILNVRFSPQNRNVLQ